MAVKIMTSKVKTDDKDLAKLMSEQRRKDQGRNSEEIIVDGKKFSEEEFSQILIRLEEKVKLAEKEFFQRLIELEEKGK